MPRHIKIRYACALSQLATPTRASRCRSVGERPAAPPRAADARRDRRAAHEELFGLVREELAAQRLRGLIAAGIVLTGGSAKMEGAIELAEEVFHVPRAPLGVPQAVGGLSDVVRNPIYSTGRGAAALRP